MTDFPPPGHLPDEKLAAYIDGSLVHAARSAVEAHLAECSECRAEFLAASRAVESAPSPAGRSRPLALATAGAAAVLLIAIILRQNGVATDDAARIRSQPNVDNNNAVPVVAPRTGDIVSPSGVRFVWRRSPGILEYTITVQDRDGRVRWSVSTADTAVLVPDSVTFASGSVLHWYVDGLRADGRAVGSGRQQLLVR